MENLTDHRPGETAPLAMPKSNFEVKMKKIIILAACLFLISPVAALEKTYKEAGFCDMIAVRNTHGVQGAARPVKQGEKLPMVGKSIAENGEILVVASRTIAGFFDEQLGV